MQSASPTANLTRKDIERFNRLLVTPAMLGIGMDLWTEMPADPSARVDALAERLMMESHPAPVEVEHRPKRGRPVKHPSSGTVQDLAHAIDMRLAALRSLFLLHAIGSEEIERLKPLRERVRPAGTEGCFLHASLLDAAADLPVIEMDDDWISFDPAQFDAHLPGAANCKER